MINIFRGTNRFLSNMYRAVFYTSINGDIHQWKSSEHYYQAHKFEGEFFEYIKNLDNPYDTKIEAHKLIKHQTADSESDYMYQKMSEAVLYKFTQNSDIKTLLLNTKDEQIIEGNTWHDNYWGNCTCNLCQDIPGINMLGQILMNTRKSLIQVP